MNNKIKKVLEYTNAGPSFTTHDGRTIRTMSVQVGISFQEKEINGPLGKFKELARHRFQNARNSLNDQLDRAYSILK